MPSPEAGAAEPAGTSGTPGPAPLRVDRAAFVAAFGQRLRAAGVPVTLTSLDAFTRALIVQPPVDVGAVYWSARVTLVADVHELPAFDAVFEAVFGAGLHVGLGSGSPEAAAAPSGLPPLRPAGVTVQPGGLGPDAADEADAPAPRRTRPLPWHTPRVQAREEEAGEAETVLPEPSPSALERVGDVPFEDLDPAQLRLLADWLEGQLPDRPWRRARRMTAAHRGGRVSVRETLARSRRTGWEAFEPVRERPGRRPRPVVMLADVSASMRPYSTAYLHLMRALARGGGAETFAFSTSVTRVTRALRETSAQDAVARASAEVVDRYGGTRVAGSLRALLASPHAAGVRGGVLVIASDGWDSDPPERLAAAMRRARLRAYRVVWLNPRAGVAGFEPRVGAMAAALPFCDAFLPAHTLNAMREALAVILAASTDQSSGARTRRTRAS
jgi:uncharacterized protein with von Willebrand factor type A (vWA) domain